MLLKQLSNVQKFYFSRSGEEGATPEKGQKGWREFYRKVGAIKEIMKSKNWDMGCLNSPFYVNFSKGCLPNILHGPFLKPLPLM